MNNSINSYKKVFVASYCKYMDLDHEITFPSLVQICLDMFEQFTTDEGTREQCFSILLQEGEDFIAEAKKQSQSKTADESTDNDDIDYKINEFGRRYRNFIPGLMDAICTMNLEPNEFYHVLWLQLNSILGTSGTDIVIACALLLWQEERIPYFNAGGECPIADAEIKRVLSTTQYRQAKKEIRYILNFDYLTKRDKAYQLMRVIDSQRKTPNKVALMAYVLTYLQSPNNER